MNSFQNYDVFPTVSFHAYAILGYTGLGQNVTLLYQPTISDSSLKLLKQSGPVARLLWQYVVYSTRMNHTVYIKHTA